MKNKENMPSLKIMKQGGQNDKNMIIIMKSKEIQATLEKIQIFQACIFPFTFSKAFLSGTFSEMFPSLPRWPIDAAIAIGPMDDL